MSPERDLRALYEGAPVEIGSVERTFAARLYDPATGSTRDIVIEISSALVAVRLTEPRRRGEDGPHHVCADFTDQATEIAAALAEANTARARAQYLASLPPWLRCDVCGYMCQLERVKAGDNCKAEECTGTLRIESEEQEGSEKR